MVLLKPPWGGFTLKYPEYAGVFSLPSFPRNKFLGLKYPDISAAIKIPLA